MARLAQRKRTEKEGLTMIIIIILSLLLLCGVVSAFVGWVTVRIGSRYPDGVIKCPYCSKEAREYLLCTYDKYSVYKINCPHCGFTSNHVIENEKGEK